MSFLRRLFGGAPARSEAPMQLPQHLQYAQFTSQRPDALLEIVGEASYQGALQAIAGPHSPNGVDGKGYTAMLIPEPSNHWDPNAIAVWVRWGEDQASLVGYLSRENAVAYAPVFRALAPRIILALAHMKGGWDRGAADRGSIGLSLNLGSPSELLAERWADDHPAAPSHAWSGKLVCFTGPSGYAIGGAQLDRLTQQYLAGRAGCTTWPRITKKVQVCIASNVEHETGKLMKAEEYNMEVVSERDFWRGVGLPLEQM